MILWSLRKNQPLRPATHSLVICEAMGTSDGESMDSSSDVGRTPLPSLRKQWVLLSVSFALPKCSHDTAGLCGRGGSSRLSRCISCGSCRVCNSSSSSSSSSSHLPA